MKNRFFNRDIVSIKDLDRYDFEGLFEATDKISNLPPTRKQKLAEGKVLSMLFYEPSTRTIFSFEAAMLAIGGSSIGFADPHSVSVEKGESLADTVRILEGYSDIIILRHPNDGAARFASEVASKPVINAGSGTEEHPTQAMLDLYTIMKEKGKIDGLNIAIVGDLKYGRTVYSLLYALARFEPQVFLVSPPQLRIRDEALYDLENRLKITQHRSMEEVISAADVLYVTRIQRERFPDPHEYEKVRGSYIVDKSTLEKAKESLIVMHPLPRGGEIKTEVDSTPQAKYFQQAHYGKALRAALIALLLNEEINVRS
ncbi:MAG: aspartate carbamoyltransferase [Thaumarchaeota archaeon]|nr:aspartate carbamoyltransferase [Nitrososphaerota archaeon]